jgi:serine/threonine-protein kinase
MAKTVSSLPPPPRPARRIAERYELLEIAGRGGMAVVWRARHHGPGHFRRPVAVKQMHAHLANDPLYRSLFEEEARVGSILQDPNIAQVYDFVEDEGQYYLVLEWVNGIDLATYIRYLRKKDQRFDWELVAAMGIGILRGLATAHERVTEEGVTEPIVHRDISPHNILVSDTGRAKLIDFGLSLAHDRYIEDTDPGMAKGKLAYLSPEVVRGARPAPKTDQFAMGSVIWETLTGKRAFEGETDLETYTKLANAEVQPLEELRPDIPEELSRFVRRALALDPADRFEDAREMARELGEVLKIHQSSEDLYDRLAWGVLAARAELGHRTQDPELEDSVIELESGLVELHLENEDKDVLARFKKWMPTFLRKE